MGARSRARPTGDPSGGVERALLGADHLLQDRAGVVDDRSLGYLLQVVDAEDTRAGPHASVLGAIGSAPPVRPLAVYSIDRNPTVYQVPLVVVYSTGGGRELATWLPLGSAPRA